MKPNEADNKQIGVQNQQQIYKIPNSSAQPMQTAQQKAATNVIRDQINDIFDKESSFDNISELKNTNPYNRTHRPVADTKSEQWKKYHSAWQDYYRRYYEGYYSHHVRRAREDYLKQLADQTQKIDQKTSPSEPIANNQEAVFNLKQKLRKTVRESATTFRKSRHFWPITSGIIVAVLFSLIQFNRVIVSNILAYVSPGSINPQNIILNPTAETIKVDPEPRLIIPKINIDVPVIYDVGNDHDSQMAAMTKGVAHFAIPGASSHPGEKGNTVLAGHSSNDLFDSGDYKFIFIQLDKLNVGDIVYANYKSTRYTYSVTKKEVVKPSEVDKLIYKTDTPILTLITCTPLGTATNRLLVSAKQVNPDPAKSSDGSTNNSQGSKSMPGNSKTIFERIFGIK